MFIRYLNSPEGASEGIELGCPLGILDGCPGIHKNRRQRKVEKVYYKV